MARFIAIPVAAGDAFYLERKGFSVLVDGGKNTSAFPQMFSQSIKKARADIVVCTHNDEDHSNGIIGFLEAGYNCQEVWLPGRWADCIDGLGVAIAMEQKPTIFSFGLKTVRAKIPDLVS